MNSRKFVIFSQQIIRFDNKVVCLITIYYVSCYLSITIYKRRKFFSHVFDFKCIIKGNGVENCFQIMVAVSSFLNNVKSKINLGARKCYHCFCL